MDGHVRTFDIRMGEIVVDNVKRIGILKLYWLKIFRGNW